MKFKKIKFKESNSDFYDLEYFLSLEYRYFSGSHITRVKKILKCLKRLNLKGKQVLDVGCGGGFLTYKISQLGANVTGCDYSQYAIKFAKERYPKLKIIRHSAYEIDSLTINNPDFITVFDVIEHMSRPEVFLEKSFKILKPGGKLIISTDNESYLFSKPPFSYIRNLLMRTSSSGRAFRLIKKVESYRRRSFKNYHQGHINVMSSDVLLKKITQAGFMIEKIEIYSLISIPILDFFQFFLPSSIKGDHQIVVAVKKE